MRYFVWFSLLLCYGLGSFYFINNDLWNDEIYTLQHFVLQPLHTTVTDYHVPNNHVLYSLICNIYLKIIGVHDLAILMQKPFILRGLGLVFSIFSILFLYKSAKKIGDADTAFWVILAYITTLPLYCFQFQIRGYGLLMCLNSLLFYAFLCFQTQKNWQNALKIVVIGGLSLYTVPSNLLVLCGFGLGIATLSAIDKITVNNTATKVAMPKSERLYSIILLFLSVLFGIILYSPMLKTVLQDSYIQAKLPLSVLWTIFGTFWFDVLSYRGGLLAFSILGVFFIIKKDDFIEKKLFSTLLLLFFILITPFIIVIIQKSDAQPRIFTAILPFIALCIGFTVDFFIKKLKMNANAIKFVHFLEVFPLFTSFFTLFLSFLVSKQTIINDLYTRKRTQELSENYYQYAYSPLREVQATQSLFRQKQNKIPIVILDAEPHDISVFLTTFDLSFCESNQINGESTKLDSLCANTDAFVAFVRYPPVFKLSMGINYPNFKLNYLNPSEKISYPKAILCQKK